MLETLDESKLAMFQTWKDAAKNCSTSQLVDVAQILLDGGLPPPPVSNVRRQFNLIRFEFFFDLDF